MAATKWNYQVHCGELSQTALDEIGSDGWELVSVLAGETGPTFYFKRPHPTLAEKVTLEQRQRYVPAPVTNAGQTQ